MYIKVIFLKFKVQYTSAIYTATLLIWNNTDPAQYEVLNSK